MKTPTLKDTLQRIAQRPITARRDGAIVTLRALAAHFGLSAEGMRKILQRDGCPQKNPNGSYPVDAIRGFMRQRGLGQRGRDPEKRKLELRRLQLDCERRELALAVSRGELVSRAEAQTICIRAITVMKEILYQKFECELPPIYGTDPAHNAALNEGAIFAALQQFCEDFRALAENRQAAAGCEAKIFWQVVAELARQLNTEPPENLKPLLPPPQTGRPIGS